MLCHSVKNNRKIINFRIMMMNSKEEVDLYRDTYVRYLGNDKIIEIDILCHDFFIFYNFYIMLKCLQKCISIFFNDINKIILIR